MVSFGGDTEGERVREALRKRAPILETLSEQPQEKPTLVDRLSISRSTVDRGIEELLETAMVERTSEGYRATVAGQAALAVHRRYVEQTSCFGTAAPVLNALPDETVIHPGMLRGCTVSFPDSYAPENAHRPVVERLERADRLRGLAPIVRSSYITLLHNAVFEQGLAVEIITGSGVRESLGDLVVVENELDALLASDAFRLLEVDEQIPYALWLMDGEWSGAGISVHDNGGSTAGVLLNDTEQALDWATEMYDSYSETATPATVEQHSV